MDVLVCFELCQERVQSAEIISGVCGVEVEYGGKGETEEEEVTGPAGQLLRIEVWQF